ncbi:MAG: hypothetical protein AAGC88_14860 [Bacteroidota bacterium]
MNIGKWVRITSALTALLLVLNKAQGQDAFITTWKTDNPDYHWIRGTKYVESGKVSSTSGVSAAVEGTLVTIEKLLGKEAAAQAMNQIAYPADQPLLSIDDSHMRFSDFMRILGKTGFTKNKQIGVYISENVNELEIAAIIDTYNRTFPARLETITMNNSPILSQHGLLIMPSSTAD